MSGRDIAVIGASAGGVEALTQLVRGLPREAPLALLVAVHIPAQATSVLPAILTRHGPFPASHSEDGEEIRHGRVYVARPDHHLMVQDGRTRVVRGPRENRHRPAVDPLFRSAARWYGPRVMGVVLSGSLDDGTAGLQAIKSSGGLAIVQNPEDALHDGMPCSALRGVDVDFTVPVAKIGPLLERLAREPLPRRGGASMPERLEHETDIAAGDIDEMEREDRPGSPSIFTCPECSGTLWELRDGELLRFRCRVGHAYSAGSLLADQGQALEGALWTALRSLEERASLVRRLADQARARRQELSASHFAEQADHIESNAAILRDMLVRGGADVAQRDVAS